MCLKARYVPDSKRVSRRDLSLGSGWLTLFEPGSPRALEVISVVASRVARG